MTEPALGDVRVRLAGAAAVDQLRALWVGLHRHHRAVATYQPLLAEDDLSWRRRRDRYLTALHDGHGLLALADTPTGPVGYAFVQLHPGPDDTFDHPDTGYAELYSLSVAPEARGHGIGRQLCELVEAELANRGITELEVAVMAGNDTALRFYQHRGFDPSEHLLRRRLPPNQPP